MTGIVFFGFLIFRSKIILPTAVASIALPVVAAFVVRWPFVRLSQRVVGFLNTGKHTDLLNYVLKRKKERKKNEKTKSCEETKGIRKRMNQKQNKKQKKTDKTIFQVSFSLFLFRFASVIRHRIDNFISFWGCILPVHAISPSDKS